MNIWCLSRVDETQSLTPDTFLGGVVRLIYFLALKPFQNKKGQKKFPGAQFSGSFSQLPAVKKDTENCAPGNFF